MINLLTEKHRNGRQTLFLLLEPQEIEHIRKGQPLTVDTSRIMGYEILVGYVPDGLKAKELIGQQMPLIEPHEFARLLQHLQQFPEVHRQPLDGGPQRWTFDPTERKKQ